MQSIGIEKAGVPSKILSKDGRFVAATVDKVTTAATTLDKLEVYILDKRKTPYHVDMVLIKNTSYPYEGKRVGYLCPKHSLVTPEVVAKSFGLTLEEIFLKLTR